MSKSKQSKTNNKPLSPHIQIYKPQINSITSILHRICGIGFVLALIMLVLFIFTLASSVNCYASYMQFLASDYVDVLIYTILTCVYYHLFNGIRYFIWETGKLFKIKQINTSGFLILLLTAIATIITVIIL